VAMHRVEWTLIAFVASAACLSFATTILCLIHRARKGYSSGRLGLILWAVWAAGKTARRRTLPAVPFWVWSFLSAIAYFSSTTSSMPWRLK
jgi:hypothetical protein